MTSTPSVAGDQLPIPEMHLELVPVPVTDVERAKEFYVRAGFGNLHDTQVTDEMRVVQFTPPGSACAIVFGTGMGPIADMEPGSVKGLHLVVDDLNASREALLARGIEVGWRRRHGWRQVRRVRGSRRRPLAAAIVASVDATRLSASPTRRRTGGLVRC